LGIGEALKMLGFNYKNKVSKIKEDFPIDELNKDLDKMPAILGPLNMGYLSYNPRYKNLMGADHYILAYKIRNEEVYLHDPAGFPFVSLPINKLREAWKASGIGYKKGYYRYITSIERVNIPTEKEIYDNTLDFFQRLYKEGEKKASKKIWLIGKEAILYAGKKIKKGRLEENEVNHFVYFALPLATKRALDFAIFFDYQDKDLASLKRKQAQLFGEAHTRTMERNWDVLSKIFEQLVKIEESFRNKIITKRK